MTSIAIKTTYLVDGIEVISFVGLPAEQNRSLAISLTTLKELRAMATISDKALADLQAAAQANADRDEILGGKVDAAIQLIDDLKLAAAQPDKTAAIQAVTTLLNGATAKAIAAEDKLDVAVAPPAPPPV